MKMGGKGNLGFGRSMNFAIKNIFDDKYGDRSFGTRRSHVARLRGFVTFVRLAGVNDLRQIRRNDLQTYAGYLRELCDQGELAVATANNRVSSANVLMELVTNGGFRPVSPSALIGRRNYVRTNEPSGLYATQYLRAIEGLLTVGEDRLALLIALCRLSGARFREASLLVLNDARRELSKDGFISIRRGTKGGKGAKQPRRVCVSEQLTLLLNTVGRKINDRSLVPKEMTYIQWYGWAHRRWAKMAPRFGMSKKYHELRSAYACDRLETLTGIPASCVNRRVPGESRSNGGDVLSEHRAREIVAVEMGHNRVDVLSSYCGSPR